MKVKTSITLSESLVEAMDELVEDAPEQFPSRSVFLESAAWAFIERVRRAERTERDIEIINRRADFLNAETMDALTYQVPL
ncbi:MAG: hypothetical protein IT331_06450 [Anaerolineae bacterium]|nr:hypothetical protein [Anaerolineae bacterium]